MCLWWTVCFGHLEPSPWRNNEVEKRRWLQVGTGDCWPHVLVRFDSTRTVWACVCMAHLSFLWQPLQICLNQPRICCHPIAFIPSVSWIPSFLAPLRRSHPIVQLPQFIKNTLSLITSKKDNCDLLSHCKRELVHAIWRILLDDEFIKAYKNSIVIKCFDGITRRVYPRILTYSADYPEKCVLCVCLLMGYWLLRRVILATIQDKGNCPCPHCLISRSMFHHTGFLRDLAARLLRARTYLLDKIKLARHAIYMLGQPLKGTTAETILKEQSLVPTLVRILFVSCSYLIASLRTLFASDYHPWDSNCTQCWL